MSVEVDPQRLPGSSSSTSHPDATAARRSRRSSLSTLTRHGRPTSRARAAASRSSGAGAGRRPRRVRRSAGRGSRLSRGSFTDGHGPGSARPSRSSTAARYLIGLADRLPRAALRRAAPRRGWPRWPASSPSARGGRASEGCGSGSTAYGVGRCARNVDAGRAPALGQLRERRRRRRLADVERQRPGSAAPASSPLDAELANVCLAPFRPNEPAYRIGASGLRPVLDGVARAARPRRALAYPDASHGLHRPRVVGFSSRSAPPGVSVKSGRGRVAAAVRALV